MWEHERSAETMAGRIWYCTIVTCNNYEIMQQVWEGRNRRWSEEGMVGRKKSVLDERGVEAVVQTFTRSRKNSVWQASHESGVSKSSVYCILKQAKWKPYISRLLHVINEDDPDRHLQFCEWICDNEQLTDLIVWSDEETFKLNGTINRHNCVYWARENPIAMEEWAVNLPGLSVGCSLSVRGIVGSFFF